MRKIPYPLLAWNLVAIRTRTDEARAAMRNEERINSTPFIAIYNGRPDLTRCNTRFNKIAIQGKIPDGVCQVAYRESTDFYPCVTRSSWIFVNFVFKHYHAASIYIYIC